jgi:hypothetical protein
MTLKIRKDGNYTLTSIVKKLDAGVYKCFINSSGKCFVAISNEYYLLLNNDEFVVSEWHSKLNIPVGIGEYA